jgi:HK97 family phage major capsid protein
MDKKWVKLLKEFQGKPAGEVVQLDAAKADTLVELAHAEAHEDPTAGIVEQAVGALDERIKQAAELAANAAFQKVAGALKGRGGDARDARGKRPSIQTHDNELDDPTGGFKHMGEYAKCVRLAAQGKAADERLQRIAKAAHGASEGSDADGGFAVPVQYAGEVFNDIQKQDSLMDLCFRIPMTSNSIKLPAINYTSQSGFGVQAYWVGEAQAPTTSKPAYCQPQLTLNALSALVPVTQELLEDGIAVAPIISFLAGEAITYKLNDAILNEDAVGKPQGIIPHAATVTVNKEGEAAREWGAVSAGTGRGRGTRPPPRSRRPQRYD